MLLHIFEDKRMSLFRGSIVAIVTPMGGGVSPLSRLDENSLAKLVR